jgi:general secretion pathway protein G
MRRSRGQAGFTLLELLIVVAIIGLLVAIAIPALQYALDKSKQRVTLSDMRMVANAVMTYNLDTSFFPSDSLNAPQLMNILSPYAGRSLPETDRWGNFFDYRAGGEEFYSLECFGRDGIDGTDIDYLTRNDFDLDIIHARGAFAASPDP